MFVFTLPSAFVKEQNIVIVSSNVCSQCFEILKSTLFNTKLLYMVP